VTAVTIFIRQELPNYPADAPPLGVGCGTPTREPRTGCEANDQSDARDQWEAAGPVVPVAGEKPHARSVAAHEPVRAS
jgi:hypothetical protein